MIEEKKDPKEICEQIGEKEKPGDKQGQVGNEEEEMDVDDSKEMEAVEPSTATVSRGTDSIFNKNATAAVEMDVDGDNEDMEVSLEAIQLEDGDKAVVHVNHMAHQLCEQLRLILEPTKAAKLQGDLRTGKRLNMRKIIPYIASQF